MYKKNTQKARLVYEKTGNEILKNSQHGFVKADSKRVNIFLNDGC